MTYHFTIHSITFAQILRVFHALQSTYFKIEEKMYMDQASILDLDRDYKAVKKVSKHY